MKPEVKKRVRRYGIPIDLVILATGFAMLVPTISAGALVALYLFAVTSSAIKFGWRSGATGLAFGLVVMAAGFGSFVSVRAYAAFIIISLIIIAAAELRRTNAQRVEASPVATAESPAAMQDDARESLRIEKEALERRLAEERLEAEAKLAEQLEKTRKSVEIAAEQKRAAEQKLEAERDAMRRRLDEERLAVERAAEQRLAAEREERARLEREREHLTRQLAEREAAKLDAERLAVLEREKEDLTRRLDGEREAAKRDAEKAAGERLAAERVELQKQFDEQMRAEREELEKAKAAAAKAALRANVAPAKSGGVFTTIKSWLTKPQPAPRPIATPRSKVLSGNATAPRRPSQAAATPPVQRPKPVLGPRERKPRILMLERRRATADVIAPKLRDAGLEVQIVERWIDAVDELFRFRPDAVFLDAELLDVAKVHRSIVEQSAHMPIVMTGANSSSIPNLPRAAAVFRPYVVDPIVKLAREAMLTPQAFLERQFVRTSIPVSAPVAPPETRVAPSAAPQLPAADAPKEEHIEDRYDVTCFNCRVAFDANDADWCSCLAKERTLVCTNCLTCFCKAPPSYKEKFWLEAPPRLFERKSAEARRPFGVPENPPEELIKRPLVLLVEDDEDIQAIVQRVCANLGYGFVSAANGQDGLQVARMYRPNLILSDAFMPKLDGREMCRILKEESLIPDCKMIVMTGLYTDTKYKTEALKRFHIDDYLAKPVSITDLINLLQRHLEGVSNTTPPEDLHELHRKGLEEAESEASSDDFTDEHSIALAVLLAEPVDEARDFRTPIPAPEQIGRVSGPANYDVCCFSCDKTFEATDAEWCTCLGRDQTLVCSHCSNCFCKAPAAYKERFWIDAPSTLFERKMIGSKRSGSGRNNPPPMEVKRPLILLVEDDENIQLIVKTVVTTLGYGFITAVNGQEGLAVAREYNPDLILSDAFMPKLDGREMCRLLKEDPATSRSKAIIMTGLYTDRKYRNEALSYFKVDDYVAKPVAVDDLIKLMKKHLPQEVQPTM